MPTLFKRSNGFYYAILSDELGRRRWVSTKERTQRAALKKLLEMGNSRGEKNPRVLLRQFYDEFRAYTSKAYSVENVAVYNRALTKFIEFCGNRTLASISAKHVDTYKAKRLQDVSPVTVNIELRTLRATFYTAHRWKLIQENPFKNVQLCAVEDVVPTHFSMLDFQRLVSAMQEVWLRNVVIVAVLTGMRRGEILNLQWSDIDLERRLIQIQSRENFRTKRGRRRVVPMNPYVYRIIQEISTKPRDTFVFTCDGEKISDCALSLRFKRLVRRLKLDDRLHFHSLRHSFATWLVQSGVSIYDVQKLLGHTSIRVTEMYSHLAPEELHRSVNRISIEMN